MLPSPLALRRIVWISLLSFLAIQPTSARAGDKTWDNGAANFMWDTSSLNFTGSAWNNAAGDGAIFGATGVGAIDVPGSINVNSMSFTVNGYSLNGAGTINFVNGVSTQTTGVINVASGATVTMNVGLGSTQTAIQKIGAGVLELHQPVNITSSFALTGNIHQLGTTPISANLIIGPAPTGSSPPGGTVRVMNSGVLPSTIKVALGAGGALDIGANNVTIGELTFTNQNQGYSYTNTGVQGSGTLRVMGDIHVIGIGSSNGGNTIQSNLDLGGGAQVIRSAAVTFFAGPANLMITGSISNGTLLKTIGRQGTGIGGQDGIALMGNNTYTGATIINGGTIGSNMASGTNASTSLKVVSAVMTLQGANGSYLAAETIDVFAGSVLSLNNNAAFGGGTLPSAPAANNNHRISDTATITLRNSGMTYVGFSGAASSETFGSLNITGGHSVMTVTPTGVGGTATLSAGSLSLDPRATMQVASGTTNQTTGTTGLLKFTSGVPTAVGGIIPRVITSTNTTGDFVTYDANSGFTPLQSYQNSMVAGANISLTGASNTNTIAVNAIKSSGSFTTTINAGQALTVTSGMMLSATGTHTISGGTLDFGVTPGVFMGAASSASHIVNSAITGSEGLLHSTVGGSLTLAGDLSGLTGTISQLGGGALNLNTSTFTGAIEVRRGTLSIGANTLPGSSPITLGVAANDADLYAAQVALSISNAGANAVISRPIIVDNGATNAAGFSLNRQGWVVQMSVLSNTTGSQTLNGDITLNTSMNVQGGGASATSTGATIFAGNITGPGTLILNNGRANFTGTLSNAGGMIIGTGGQTGIAHFQGMAAGAYAITVVGGNTNTGFSYSNQSNIGTGLITVDAAGNPLPTIRILGTSSISNPVNFVPLSGTFFVGGVNVDVAPTMTGTWNGAVTGVGAINKINTGTLILTNSGNTYTGNTTVTAGTLRLTGSGAFASSPIITVGSAPASGAVLDVSGVTSGANYDPTTLGGSFKTAGGQTLKGFGNVTGKTVISNGSNIAPGGSIGTLTFDNDLHLSGAFQVEVASTGAQLADQILLTGGNLTIGSTASIVFSLTNTYDNSSILTLMSVTGGGTLSGVFTPGFVFNMPTGYELQYTGFSLLLAPVPEPGSLALVGLVVAAGWVVRRRKRTGATFS